MKCSVTGAARDSDPIGSSAAEAGEGDVHSCGSLAVLACTAACGSTRARETRMEGARGGAQGMTG